MNERLKVLEYAKRCAEDARSEIGTWRQHLTFRDQVYQRQLTVTKEQIESTRRMMDGGGRLDIARLEVPIVMPQIESAVAYQAGVFLSSHPIFGMVSAPNRINEALQFETVIAAHAERYGWSNNLIQVFRDGFKYNWGASFVHWKKQAIKSVSTSSDQATAGLSKFQTRVTGGNCIRRLDPYNCFFDNQISPSDYHQRGEYFGWNELVNSTTLRRFVNSLDVSYTTWLQEAFNSSYNGGPEDANSATGYYRPSVNKLLTFSRGAVYGDTNWIAWVQDQNQRKTNPIDYKDKYVLTTLIFRVIPTIIGRTGSTPITFLVHIVNWQHVIYAEELHTAHDMLPVIICVPNNDGLDYQTQSMLDNAAPYQDMVSSLWNATLDAKRRETFDRLIYNPRHINKEDIDQASAVARIPLRNFSQFKGDDIGRAIYQVPFRGEAANANIQMAEVIAGMADNASGQNKVDRGQFQKGNKTRAEFETTMGNSSSRQQLTALSIENSYFHPVKEIIKSNTLQYQSKETFLNTQTKEEIAVDPVQLREALLAFRMTDGALPMEKLMNPELMMVFLQTAQALPMAMAEYDVLGMFVYWLKLQGAYWLNDFKRNPAQQQQFLGLLQQTSMAQNAQPQPPAPGSGEPVSQV